ncbi:MAG TPA: outer-membrane lipoprotein carrier protein LolA, partial [Longimicrobiales bacterium]|nr:outer-membrane lipoprotein carrier protein LolA [Longimicrobiales bacterium]
RTESAGTLYQRQPDLFLMRFSDPEGDVIVSDGDYFWVYYPSVDPKQVIRSERGAQGLDLRSQFVGDPTQRFNAEYNRREEVRGRPAHVVTLVPREALGYRRLVVWIDAEDRLVRRFELTEENSNVRCFELTDLRVNPELPASLFAFDPPADAHVVRR